ncbi:MAG: hypothetical protein P8048_13660, partial [Calditrichia bacterium]
MFEGLQKSSHWNRQGYGKDGIPDHHVGISPSPVLVVRTNSFGIPLSGIIPVVSGPVKSEKSIINEEAGGIAGGSSFGPLLLLEQLITKSRT